MGRSPALSLFLSTAFFPRPAPLRSSADCVSLPPPARFFAELRVRVRARLDASFSLTSFRRTQNDTVAPPPPMGANGSKSSFSFADCGARDSDDSDSGLPICGGGGRSNRDGTIGTSSAGFSFGSSSAGNFTPRSGIGSSSSMTPRTAERASTGPGQRAQNGSRNSPYLNSPRYSAAIGDSGGLMIESGDGSSREVSAEAGMETSRRAERRKMSVEEYHGAASPRNPRAERRKQSPGGSGSHRNSPRGRSSKGAGRRNYLPPKDENGKFAALASNVDAHDEPLYTLPGEDEGGVGGGASSEGKLPTPPKPPQRKLPTRPRKAGARSSARSWASLRRRRSRSSRRRRRSS